MSNDLDQAFIDYDLDVPQVKIADISAALMEVSANIEQVLDEISQSPAPTTEMLREWANYLLGEKHQQDRLITNALGIVAEMTVRKVTP
jgi:ElaB/YqjD/DUF883 family membrane-anchored ribosome-binding protein